MLIYCFDEFSLLSKMLKTFPYQILCILILFFPISCSEDKTGKTADKDQASSVDQKSTTTVTSTTVKKSLEFPIVYVEELDQSQEFYKEQHETSFSYVTKKNWFSYTAGKDGILTKILLFGKPNFQPSDHYGDSMHGFFREGNPDNGPKYGEWELSRDDIVNQIAAQNLSPRQAGWITIRMRGEIPQIAGKTYFLVCEKITGGKPWFGAFAFGEGNPYKAGKFWLHPEHDLVFRTYVGKTPQQVAREKESSEFAQKLKVIDNNIPQSPDNLPTAFPISQSLTNNAVITKPDDLANPNSSFEVSNFKDTNLTQPIEEIKKVEKLNIIADSDTELLDQNKSQKNKSLFNRLFKKD